MGSSPHPAMVDGRQAARAEARLSPAGTRNFLVVADADGR